MPRGRSVPVCNRMFQVERYFITLCLWWAPYHEHNLLKTQRLQHPCCASNNLIGTWTLAFHFSLSKLKETKLSISTTRKYHPIHPLIQLAYPALSIILMGHHLSLSGSSVGSDLDAATPFGRNEPPFSLSALIHLYCS